MKRAAANSKNTFVIVNETKARALMIKLKINMTLVFK